MCVKTPVPNPSLVIICTPQGDSPFCLYKIILFSKIEVGVVTHKAIIPRLPLPDYMPSFIIGLYNRLTPRGAVFFAMFTKMSIQYLFDDV